MCARVPEHRYMCTCVHVHENEHMKDTNVNLILYLDGRLPLP